MNIVLFGATKGMGRALARLMAERGDHLFLLGRNEQDLQRSASDLRARTLGSVSIGTAVCDLRQPDHFATSLALAAEALGSVDTIVVSAAMFATQDALEKDADLVSDLLELNFSHTILFCEQARKHLLSHGGGTLCVFSSVAGDRGRKPVILYGAAKAGLSYYLEALDHRYRSEGLKTVCVKPGFVKTSMTSGLKPPPFSGEPEAVARCVLKAIDRGQPMVYAPRAWRAIMGIIRHLPRSVMRRMAF